MIELEVSMENATTEVACVVLLRQYTRSNRGGWVLPIGSQEQIEHLLGQSSDSLPAPCDLKG